MPLLMAAILFFSMVEAAAADDSRGQAAATATPQDPPEQPVQAPAPPQPTPPEPAAASPPVVAQPVQPAPAPIAVQPAPAAFPVQPAPVNKPGFLHEFGRWWDESLANFNARMKDSQDKMSDFNVRAGKAAKDAAAASQEAMKKAAEAAKQAATAVVRLPNTRIIEVREKCALANNGAPDCTSAANTACRGKGFNTGQPVDIRTSQNCPASVWLSGQAPKDGECPRETIVTRAVCQ
jgi:outer membrane biosynthesis protein TonB